MKAIWLGRVEYASAWQLQRELAALRSEGRSGDILLLLEHPPTITVGRGADARHVLVPAERLASLGVVLHKIDRGGDVTYHGPGQLVGYPIFDLTGLGKDLHRFLRRIEEALIQALVAFGVTARRFPPHTGVWINDAKVAAIGIKVSRWISTHGFALNVSPDLSHFNLIVPCGIVEYGVTSLSTVTGRPLSVTEAIPPVVRAFRERFRSERENTGNPLSLLSQESQKIFRQALDVTESL